jgi:hypothetical protein
MLSETCLAVEAWLHQNQLFHLRTMHSPQLATHVATCLRCQTQVAQFLVTVNSLFSPVPQIDCASCQVELAAYAELVSEQGVLLALNSYPHIWLHLWHCANCTEQLHIILALLEAEKAGTLPPLPIEQPSRVLRPEPKRDVLITFPRQWLAALLVPGFGPTLGDTSEATTLIDAERGGFHVRCTVAQAGAGCTAEIYLDPPVEGVLVLLLGVQQYRIPIAANGVTTIEALPTSLLYNTNGPDLTIAIERTPMA